MENVYDDHGTYGTQTDTCPLCGSGKPDHTYDITRYLKPFRIDRCLSCGFMFMNPRFNDDVIREFYGQDYYNGRADYAYCDERRIWPYARHVWDRRIRVIRRYADGGNFLDVGSAFGGLLSRADPYYTTWGIEISPYAAAHSRENTRATIHNGTLENHPFKAGQFSAITMIEVIEHLADPVSALRECYSLLRTGGVLVIQTANMDGLQAVQLGQDYAYFMPGHLSYFSMKNLTGALRREGFSRIRVYRPVEFGLLPKLLKSRGSFTSWKDYRNWARITWYHLQSMVHLDDFSLTSSMVVYAVK